MKLFATLILSAVMLLAEPVYFTKTGKKFHKATRCGQMTPDKAMTADRTDATSHGLTQCGRCYRAATAGKSGSDKSWATPVKPQPAK
jgi:hypothetical protein